MPFAVTTLADLKALLRQRTDGSVWWVDEEARLALNEALRLWNLLTGRWRRRVTLSTGAGTVEYALPSTLIYGTRVLSVGRALTATSTLELDLMRPTWRSETTASGGAVPTVPLLWAPISIQRIAIWPATAGIVLSGLTIDGVSNTPVLVEDADFIDASEEVVDYLADFALHVLAFTGERSVWLATRLLYQQFLQAAAEENGVLKRNLRFRKYAGLDRRRDLQPAKDAPTRLDSFVQRGGGGGQP